MSAVPAVQRALREVCADLWPSADASLGAPNAASALDLAVVGKGKSEISTPTAGGAKRSLEETVSVTVVLSSYRATDTEEAQDEANQSAWDSYTLLCEYFRTNPNNTLGGVCRDAMVTEGESDDYRYEDDAGNVTGRATDITVTVTAQVRL